MVDRSRSAWTSATWGASSTIEPLNLAPGSTSSADAGPTQVGVYMSRKPRGQIGGPGVVKLGDISVPAVPQNSIVEASGTVTLPSTPPRKYPGDGGTVYVFFRADDTNTVRDLDRTNNVSTSVPVQINAPLPDLAAISISLPPTIQPGDSIAPVIKIANYGTVDTSPQGPVTVLLVASTDQNYGPTDAIVGQYSITNIAPLSEAPSKRTVLGDVNLDNPPNVVTLTETVDGSPTVTLPAGGPYYLGVIVDPLNTIREIHEIGPGPSSALKLVQTVQAVPGLPSAGVLSDPAPAGNVFPYPAYAPLAPLDTYLSGTDLNQTLYTTGGNDVAFRGAKKPNS